MIFQHFTTQQCILPGYTYLQEAIISKALTTEEERLIALLQTHLSAQEVVALDDLFTLVEGRYRLTLLRRAPKTLSHGALRQERNRAAALLPLATCATRVLPMLAISAEATTYYASLVGYYSAARLKNLETKMVGVYLLCFVQQRYQKVHDHLLSGLMHAIKDYWDAAKTAAKDRVYTYRTALTTDLVQAGRVLQLVADGPLPPTMRFAHVQATAFGLLDRAALARTAEQLLAEGQDPTLILVQERVGGGSYSTVKKHLDAWKARREAPPPVTPVPPALADYQGRCTLGSCGILVIPQQTVPWSILFFCEYNNGSPNSPVPQHSPGHRDGLRGQRG
jgi:hypothetical protein